MILALLQALGFPTLADICIVMSLGYARTSIQKLSGCYGVVSKQARARMRVYSPPVVAKVQTSAAAASRTLQTGSQQHLEGHKLTTAKSFFFLITECKEKPEI